MQLAQVPLTVSSHESAQQRAKQDNPAQLRRNVELFRREVEKEVSRMAEQHAQEVRRLCTKIQQQQRVIDAYERKFGRINEQSPARKENNVSQDLAKRSSAVISASFTPSPNRSANLQNSNILNRLSQSPIKLVQKNSAEMEGMILGQSQSFEGAPPDELYKSRYQQRSRSKKLSERDVYNTLYFLQQRRKQNKERIDDETQRLLEIVGEAQPKEQETVELDRLQTKELSRRVKDRDEQLNTSLSFICDSLERSKDKIKQRKSLKPVKTPENPELEVQEPLTQKRKEGKQRLQFILREMRDKISAKPVVSPKKEEIKTSKLLTTGHPGTSKVLINPVPMDLARKDSARTGSPNTTFKNTSSILKNTSQGRYTKTIEGLSEISKVTRQSSTSRLFV